MSDNTFQNEVALFLRKMAKNGSTCSISIVWNLHDMITHLCFGIMVISKYNILDCEYMNLFREFMIRIFQTDILDVNASIPYLKKYCNSIVNMRIHPVFYTEG